MATMRVFYSNDPPYEIGVPVRLWVDDLGRLRTEESVRAHEKFLASGAPGSGPLGLRIPLDGGWQMIRPEETCLCNGCHNAHLATTLTPGEVRYCALCTIKWRPCRVCGQTQLHGLHTAEEWEALRNR